MAKTIAVVGLVASLIGIFVFATGIQSLPEVLRRNDTGSAPAPPDKPSSSGPGRLYLSSPTEARLGPFQVTALGCFRRNPRRRDHVECDFGIANTGSQVERMFLSDYESRMYDDVGGVHLLCGVKVANQSGTNPVIAPSVSVRATVTCKGVSADASVARMLRLGLPRPFWRKGPHFDFTDVPIS